MTDKPQDDSTIRNAEFDSQFSVPEDTKLVLGIPCEVDVFFVDIQKISKQAWADMFQTPMRPGKIIRCTSEDFAAVRGVKIHKQAVQALLQALIQAHTIIQDVDRNCVAEDTRRYARVLDREIETLLRRFSR